MKKTLFAIVIIAFMPLTAAYADDATTTPALTDAAATTTEITANATTTSPDVATSTVETSDSATSTPVTSDATSTDATTTPETITFAIRDGATLLGPWMLKLPSASSTPLSVIPTSGTTTPIDLSAQSVLGVLETLDAQKDDFSINDLQYFDFGQPYAGGLYLNCLTIPVATTTPACAQWQYSVNGVAPSQGAGVTALHDGDTVFLYYGSPRQVALSTSTVAVGASFTATAQIYDPSTNSWSPATGVTIGVVQPDPANPWSPIEIATSTVDSAGQAVFALDATGTYQVGIQQDFYSPTTNITVVEAAATSTGSDSDTTPPPAPGPITGGGGGITHSSLNIASALAYLASQQRSDGSFDAPIYTDWAALAFAATGESPAKTKLRSYLASSSPALSSVTDYERHAMALESLGIDPRTGAPTDYIAPIAKAFDGTQIGTPDDNDDIFAIFPLMFAGYSPTDPMIQKEIAFILSRQKSDGSWDESPDMTAAAIQAIGPFLTTPEYTSAMKKAVDYLASKQQGNGGWSNIDSTSWVQTAITAMQQADLDQTRQWTSNEGYYPSDAIANAQTSDGAVGPPSDTADNRVWSTSYAVVAASGKSWLSILQPFPFPAGNAASNGSAGAVSQTAGGAIAPSATSTQATTTPLLSEPSATSTASTTPDDSMQALGASSTTVPVIAPTVTASTSTPAVRHAKPKVKIATNAALKPIPAPASAQAAAAANSDGGNIVLHMWNAVVSFFRRIF